MTWAIDNGVGTPAQFVLSGVQGKQTLKLVSSTLPAGADYTIHITATTSATECGVYDNTAKLTLSSTTLSAEAKEVCNPANVSITKTADASPVNAGDQIGFTVEVQNTGTGVAKGVTLDRSASGWLGDGCDVGGRQRRRHPGEVRSLRRAGQPDAEACVEHAAGGCGLHDSHHGGDVGNRVRQVRQHRAR